MERNCFVLGTRRIVPTAFRSEILDSIHKLLLGISRVKATLRQYYWLPGSEVEAETYTHVLKLSIQSKNADSRFLLEI